MAAFRDDREALLARIDALEQELARGGSDDERAATRRRLDELAAAVRETTARMERDRGVLDELGARLDAMRRDLPAPAPFAPPEPAPQPAPAAAPTAAVEVPSRAVLSAGIVFGGLALLVMLIAVVSSSDDPPEQARPPTTEGPRAAGSDLPGGLHAFDPSAGLALARERSPLGRDAPLSSIRAVYVSSDGRVDLDAAAYQGRVDYEFYRPAEEPTPDTTVPLGVARPVALGRAGSVQVTAAGMSAGVDMPFPIGQTLPDPRCTLADVWRLAIQQGAPREAVATIEYGGSSLAPRWTLSITGTPTQVLLPDADCAAEPRRAD